MLKKNIRLFYWIPLLILMACGTDSERKFILSSDGNKILTILKLEDKIYLIYGKYESDRIPDNGFIKNMGGIEYYPGLVNWTADKATIYTHYGVYETVDTTGKIELIKVSTREFEQLKIDSLNHQYFYY